jgi:UDPglucose 6-dehydrogenase
VIGVVGLGRVGLVLAQALRHVAKYEVMGYDLHPDRVLAHLNDPQEDIPTGELYIAADIKEVATKCDRIFIVVQTPHPADYGGDTPVADLPPIDFNYSYLEMAVQDITEQVGDNDPILVVVSTVTPGTIRNRILPLTHLKVVYCPVFISLGSVLHDLLNPPFVLLGGDDIEALVVVDQVMKRLRQEVCPTWVPGLEAAELTKMAYNCYRSFQIVYANALSELAESFGVDVDRVTGILDQAPRLPVSAGMGDGGACRPRDAIAMSWIAGQHDLSINPFSFLIQARERQSMNLAETVLINSLEAGLDICVLGVAYKPDTKITEGSPGLLLYNQIRSLLHYVKEPIEVFFYDPLVYPNMWNIAPMDVPHVYVIATKHEQFKELTFPSESIVIDPWGWLKFPPQDGITYRSPGRLQSDS